MRSVHGAEKFAFADAIHEAPLIHHDLRSLLGNEVPLCSLTDSLSLFSITILFTCTTEGRLMIDVQVVREAFNRKDLAENGWIKEHELWQTLSQDLQNATLCCVLLNTASCRRKSGLYGTPPPTARQNSTWPHPLQRNPPLLQQRDAHLPD